MSEKSKQIATAFKKSNASFALYAEHLLNQKLKNVLETERFRQQMNTHANVDTPWYCPGGTALIVDNISRGHNAVNKVDSSGLGR